MNEYFAQNLENLKKIALSQEVSLGAEEVIIDVNFEDLLTAIGNLKNNSISKARCLIGIFGVHYPHKISEFQVEYLLLNLEDNVRFRVRVNCAQNDKIPSIASVFEGAVWYEREAFDMFGINFENAPDLRRILTDYNFTNHPLRKDFPLIGYEEVRYDPVTQSVEKYPTNLSQEYRNFDYETPWNTEYLQNQIKKS